MELFMYQLYTDTCLSKFVKLYTKKGEVYCV